MGNKNTDINEIIPWFFNVLHYHFSDLLTDIIRLTCKFTSRLQIQVTLTWLRVDHHSG